MHIHILVIVRSQFKCEWSYSVKISNPNDSKIVLSYNQSNPHTVGNQISTFSLFAFPAILPQIWVYGLICISSTLSSLGVDHLLLKIFNFTHWNYFDQNIIIIEKDYKISKLDRPRNCQPHTFFSDILLFADLQHSPGQPAAWAVAISEEKTSRGKTRWKKGKNAPRRFRIHSSCLFPFPNFLMYT